jgi:hypothetical protein
MDRRLRAQHGRRHRLLHGVLARSAPRHRDRHRRLIFGSDAASGYLYGQLNDLLGDQGADAVRDMVESAHSSGEGIIATTVGRCCS